jgi:transposase
LAAADGTPNAAIAEDLGVEPDTVKRWRDAYSIRGLSGLQKDDRPGGKRSLPPAKEKAIIEATLHTKPPNATQWTIRTMAKAQGVNRNQIQRIWQRYNLKPHLVETFKLSNDPQFIEKLTDVVGLYMNPPEHAIVLSFDEKSQIQALERTQLLLPIGPGVPEKQTHDYKRNGTTTLFAALNMLDGAVIGECMPRHTHIEFLTFMKRVVRESPKGVELHVIMDNYATHKHPDVKRWLRRNKRVHFHFIPTSSSWLNLIERWFGELTEKRIRRGSFKSVKVLIQAIEDYIAANNKAATPFIWTAGVDKILAKIAKVRALAPSE